MYVSKAKSSFGQIEFSKLPEEEKVKFRKARIKEVDSLIKNKAVRVLSIEDSIAFEEQWPEQVINSRFVDRFKPKDVSPEKIENYKKKAIDEGHLEAIALEEDQQNPKSRLCVIGWEDPQIMEVERSAPTPLLHFSPLLPPDGCFKTVDHSSSRRENCLLASSSNNPEEETGHPATHETSTSKDMIHDSFCFLRPRSNGLVSGPSWWRRSLLKLATETLGYEVNKYDRCILTLPAPGPGNPPTMGFTVIEVDDIAEAGGPEHQKLMQRMEGLLTFGKVDNLQSENGSNYAGRRLKQRKDFSFELDMDEFIYTRLQPIPMTRKVLKKDAAQFSVDRD